LRISQNCQKYRYAKKTQISLGPKKYRYVGVIKGVKAWVMTSHEEVSIEFKNSVTIGFTNSG
jgi:hypothetical protein